MPKEKRKKFNPEGSDYDYEAVISMVRRKPVRGGRGGQGACGGTRKYNGLGPNRKTTRQPVKKKK